jgi:hypothetical protein
VAISAAVKRESIDCPRRCEPEKRIDEPGAWAEPSSAAYAGAMVT